MRAHTLEERQHEVLEDNNIGVCGKQNPISGSSTNSCVKLALGQPHSLIILGDRLGYWQIQKKTSKGVDRRHGKKWLAYLVLEGAYLKTPAK